jgi:hypothetical protein
MGFKSAGVSSGEAAECIEKEAILAGEMSDADRGCMPSWKEMG